MMASKKISFDSSRINAKISRNREKYFERLFGVAYLDHAAAAQYSDLHIAKYTQDLTNTLYGNPHSGSDSSVRATDVVNSVRDRVLKHFNTTSQEYTVIFTRNCTGALHLLAESFQLQSVMENQSSSVSEFSKESSTPKCRCEAGAPVSFDDHLFVNAKDIMSISEQETKTSAVKKCSKCKQPKSSSKRQSFYVYLDDNHTSVLGIRAIMADRGAKICCTTPTEIRKYLLSTGDDDENECGTCEASLDENGKGIQQESPQTNNLFAYPAQSNFNGCRYPLPWTNQIRRHVHCTETSCNRWFVLLDAAAMLTTSTVDLSLWQPDFMTLSFYKMFGFPTGVGALIVKNSSADVLKRSYFGGGTIELLLAREHYHVSRRNLSERFEDGTLPFLEILAVKHGFDTLETVAGTTREIALHAFSLARFVFLELLRWQHDNGKPVAVLYHDDKTFSSMETQGPIINFNLLRSDGSYIGYAEVGKLAPMYGIHLRTGCFCNAGRCQFHLQLTGEKIRRNHEAGHTCGDSMDVIDGRPMGSVRISFGFSSTLEDCHTFLGFVKDCFVDVSTDNDVQLNQVNSTTETACYDSCSKCVESVVPVVRAGHQVQKNVAMRGLYQKYLGHQQTNYKYVDSSTTSKSDIELPDIAERRHYVTSSTIPNKSDKMKLDVERQQDANNSPKNRSDSLSQRYLQKYASRQNYVNTSNAPIKDISNSRI